MEKTDKPESRLAQFDREVATITQRRGETYGHPADDFATASRLMAEFDHIEDAKVRHAIRMICVKLARIATTPYHVDHYVDIAGYARTAVMCMERAENDRRRENDTAKMLGMANDLRPVR